MQNKDKKNDANDIPAKPTESLEKPEMPKVSEDELPFRSSEKWLSNPSERDPEGFPYPIDSILKKSK